MAGPVPATCVWACCRPGEGRDPYRGIYLWRMSDDDLRKNCALGLWVPAFAGTTDLTCSVAAPASAIPRQTPRMPRARAAAGGGSDSKGRARGMVDTNRPAH